jgi:Asp-tRNA(Asn)/Glu-tRNA(Gln) amidotransferase A subunit family amidase
LTRNPYDLGHTPGGSSSGSAAAVADLHVPLAFGTQTAGSIIRPASFTGIYGVKPTYGVVSYEGAKSVSPTLDTIGWYGRSVRDLQLVGRAFRLPGMHDVAPVPLKGLRIGLCRTPMLFHPVSVRMKPAAVASESAVDKNGGFSPHVIKWIRRDRRYFCNGEA